MPRNDLKAYTSLIARIPQDLADQVKRYAREHRCSVSEIIRDGLEMRLEADSPWHAPGRSRTPDGEVLPEVLHALEALTPMLRTQLQDTVRTIMTEVLHEVIPRESSQCTAASEVVHEVLPDTDEGIHEGVQTTTEGIPGHTSMPQAPSPATNGGMTEVVSDHTEVIPARPTARTARRGMTKVIPAPPPPAQPRHEGMTEVVPFDTAKYVLGKLCPRGHAWGNTGQSLLRRTNRHCGACDREKFHERGKVQRQGRRQQQRQQGVRA